VVAGAPTDDSVDEWLQERQLMTALMKQHLNHADEKPS
jgi:hypothetical protein